MTLFAFLLVSGLSAFCGPLCPTASAGIYRWEDDSGVVHFTDDISSIPSKYKGKAKEILKTPPPSGQPSLSPMGSPSASPAAPAPSVKTPETAEQPMTPVDDAATQAEKLRAKIEAKEKFIRDVDQKQSLAINPYRNRNVSSPDLDLYRKYKEELPRDQERLKELESAAPPVSVP